MNENYFILINKIMPLPRNKQNKMKPKQKQKKKKPNNTNNQIIVSPHPPINLNLPSITEPATPSTRWVNNLGLNLIKSAEVTIGGVVVAKHTTKSCIVCNKTELFDELYYNTGKIWFCSDECRKIHTNLLKYYLSKTFGLYLADLILDKRKYDLFEEVYRIWMDEDSKNKHSNGYQKLIGNNDQSTTYEVD